MTAHGWSRPRGRPAGPVGLGSGDGTQLRSWFRPPEWQKWGTAARQLVARVYFRTAKWDLDGNDYAVLAGLADHYKTFAAGRRVRLMFEGRADERGGLIRNEDLSAARAKTVRKEVIRLLAHEVLLSTAWKAWGELWAGRTWEQDRRVDVFEVSPWSSLPSDASEHTLEELKENRYLYRLKIFEHWHPQWDVWRSVRHVLEMYEVRSEELRSSEDQTAIPLRPADLVEIEEVLKRISPEMRRRFEVQAPSADELREAFFVEYRNAWREALDAAQRECYGRGLHDLAECLVTLGVVKTAPSPP